MSELTTLHLANGATLANDGIPLHYGNLQREYQIALNHAILLDRSHEGRIALTGRDALALLNRMTTNKTDILKVGEGCGTIFLTSNARIIERVDVIKRANDVVLLTQPPRLESLMVYLKRNIFYNDQVTLSNLTSHTAAFALHGAKADAIVEAWQIGLSALPLYASRLLVMADCEVTLVKRIALAGLHYFVICNIEDAAKVYHTLLKLGQSHSLAPAGSLTYNTLRIRAGVPSLPELTEDNIPLELGLWNDVSFNKGCYTGQEIIARMDSREKLARVLVRIHLSQFVAATAQITLQEKVVGTVTSSVQAPDGSIFAMGLVKATVIENVEIQVNSVQATVGEILGTQPEWVR